MKNYARTDLACESVPSGIKKGVFDGVGIDLDTCDGVEVIKTEVLNEKGEAKTGRKKGKYITLCCGKVWMYGEEEISKIRHVIVQNIKNVLDASAKGASKILVAGLGNRFITADALGPLTIDKMTATRHMKDVNRPVFDAIGSCELSLIAPGVVGQTGVEASDIISGMAKCTGAECIIVIDALASRSTDRLCSTVQISDTGIHPGAGIGNSRKEISQKTMNVPVISIGVPTVVDSATMIYDALEKADLGSVSKELESVLSNGKSFFVSPKESDIVVSAMSELLASAITSAVGNK